MSNYPKEISNATLDSLAHITDETIVADIADTEAEIVRLRESAEHHDGLSRIGPTYERRMEAIRAEADRHGIVERKEFIAFLKRLQAARAVPA